MSVHIHLDKPHAFYTNLDFISGKIILSLTNDETISAILVKLEGESKTILIRNIPEHEQTKDRTTVATENHKILYKTQQVFPSHEPNSGSTTGQAYTLRAGLHEYPFRFKFPFNNGCATHTQSLGFAGIRLLDYQQLQYRHITKTLPPSLSGFPGMAEIRYYVKATVQRPSIWKGNRRGQVGFKFLPIEPPRAPRTNAETFARRPHEFKSGLAPYARKSSMFRKNSIALSDTPPSILADARLPSPSILTCNEPVPLRLLIKKQSRSPEYVFLVALQIELIGFTQVKAQDAMRTETGSWMIGSLTGLSIPVSNPTDTVGSEFLVDSKLWDRIPLPHTITPSFETCNLKRIYEMEVRVTLGYGHPGDIQPQTQTLPLRFSVQVYSGIAPPLALLSAMAAASRPSEPINNSPTSRPWESTTNTSIHSPTRRRTYDAAYPPQLGTPGAPAADDAPPSYEDAMADEIGPVDGPREYSGVTNENAPSDVGESGDQVPPYSATPRKSGNSGRLFPDSGPGRNPGGGSGSGSGSGPW